MKILAEVRQVTNMKKKLVKQTNFTYKKSIFKLKRSTIEV